MEINKNNYEAYFLDYWENNLQPEMVAELMIFLEGNPDLKGEFNEFENIVLVPDESIKFQPNKELKKKEVEPVGEIQSDNYEHYMVGDLEGDLTKKEAANFKYFLNINPHLKLEYNLLKLTFLNPDEKIVYVNKDTLKKSGLFVLYKTQVLYGLSIAASLIILLGFYFGISWQNNINRYAEEISKMGIIQPDIYNMDNTKVIYRTVYNSKEVIDKTNESAPEITSGLRSIKIVKISSKNTSNIILRSDKDFQERYISTRVAENSIQDEIPVYANSENLPIVRHKDKSFIGRFVSSLAGKVVNTKNQEKKSFYEFTIDGYNFLADKEVEVQKRFDENGNVIAYNLSGSNIDLPALRKSQMK